MATYLKMFEVYHVVKATNLLFQIKTNVKNHLRLLFDLSLLSADIQETLESEAGVPV